MEDYIKDYILQHKYVGRMEGLPNELIEETLTKNRLLGVL